jgi:hypothetical protein
MFFWSAAACRSFSSILNFSFANDPSPKSNRQPGGAERGAGEESISGKSVKRGGALPTADDRFFFPAPRPAPPTGVLASGTR